MASKPDDAAIQSRVMSHLNKDHQDSLVLYLEHYARLSSFSARNARLTSLSLSGLTISASGATHTIPYPNGPLASYAEVRPAVVAMDGECRAKLDRSEVTVREFVPPTGLNVVFAIWVFHNIVTMWDPSRFYLPGTWAYEHVYGYAPWYADLCYKNAWWVFWMIWLGHGVELPTMLIPKLRKYNVPLGTGLWWKWVASQFIFDGFATINRLDALVKTKLAEKEKSSH